MFVIMYTSYVFADMFLCISVYFRYNCNLLQQTFDILCWAINTLTKFKFVIENILTHSLLYLTSKSI